MRVTEDAVQDAWLALLERGGPSSVRNPELWLKRAARLARFKDMEIQARRRAAEQEYVGLPGVHSALTKLREVRVENSRLFRLRHPGYYDYRAAQKKEKYHSDEAFREKEKARWRAYRARKKAEKAAA